MPIMTKPPLWELDLEERVMFLDKLRILLHKKLNRKVSDFDLINSTDEEKQQALNDTLTKRNTS